MKLSSLLWGPVIPEDTQLRHNLTSLPRAKTSHIHYTLYYITSYPRTLHARPRTVLKSRNALQTGHIRNKTIKSNVLGAKAVAGSAFRDLNTLRPFRLALSLISRWKRRFENICFGARFIGPVYFRGLRNP